MANFKPLRPGFASFFEEQNDKILNGTITTPGAHLLHIDTLGIVNGCLDLLGGALAYADMGYNVCPEPSKKGDNTKNRTEYLRHTSLQ
jgi:hypothetical protein